MLRTSVIFLNNMKRKVIMQKSKIDKKIAKPKKSRAKYECPPKLSVFLSTIDLLRPEDILIPLDIGSREINQQPFASQELYLKALKGLQEKVANYSTNFQEYIYGRKVGIRDEKFFKDIKDKGQFPDYSLWKTPDLDEWEIRDALIRYEDFIEHRHLLNGLCKFSGLPDRPLPYLIQTNTRFLLDNEGRICIKSDKIVEALNGVYLKRIRICEICNRIFWANRKDSKTCSKPCLNNYQQRQFRSKNKEEIKLKRQANYAYKQSIKKTKGEKNNGSL
jgi:hypothetical protein